MNRIQQLFEQKKENILSVYFTAGYPQLNDTEKIIKYLEEAGVDLIEIGIPFSDPIADGAVIQASSQKSLHNGMNLSLLFEQLKEIRKTVKIPLILMGYLNPIMQFGIDEFCKKAFKIGIDGTIIPDLPFNLYEKNYLELFKLNNLANIQLITPRTSIKRMKEIEKSSEGFLYMVSSSATTGTKGISEVVLANFVEKIEQAGIKIPRLIGFGISDVQSFKNACKFSQGAIIGSAFIKALSDESDLKKAIFNFINKIKSK
jgi:tryptophan synthase alpha chain